MLIEASSNVNINGIFRHTPEAKPSIRYSNSTLHYLIARQQIWRYSQTNKVLALAVFSINRETFKI